MKPSEDRGWFGLGRVESEREDVKPAREHLARALKHNPDDYVALTGLGLLELKRGNRMLRWIAMMRIA